MGLFHLQSLIYHIKRNLEQGPMYQRGAYEDTSKSDFEPKIFLYYLIKKILNYLFIHHSIYLYLKLLLHGLMVGRGGNRFSVFMLHDFLSQWSSSFSYCPQFWKSNAFSLVIECHQCMFISSDLIKKLCQKEEKTLEYLKNLSVLPLCVKSSTCSNECHCKRSKTYYCRKAVYFSPKRYWTI